MVLDPILRFNWIFYAIYAHDVQHSALLSFFMAFSEICRRGMWSIFRVENEHCTNVLRFRASRDIPLPYDIPSASSRISLDELPHTEPSSKKQHDLGLDDQPDTYSTGADVEQAPASSSARQRRSSVRSEVPTPVSRRMTRVGALMASAHAQDFERKKRPNVLGASSGDQHAQDTSDEDEDEDDDDDGDDEN
jgi:hypothetical protein